MPATYVLGLDLGPPGEPTGFAVLERPAPKHPPVDPVYSVRHLERSPPGTSYPTIIETVIQRAHTPQLKGSHLIVDKTAVGPSVIDLLYKAHPMMTPVVISAGQGVHYAEGGGLMVPKKDLVTALQLLLQGKRLKVASGLPDTELLVAELNAFRLRRVPLADTDSAEWRVGHNDDLVFAVALACWHAERPVPGSPEVVKAAPSPRYPPGMFRR